MTRTGFVPDRVISASATISNRMPKSELPHAGASANEGSFPQLLSTLANGEQPGKQEVARPREDRASPLARWRLTKGATGQGVEKSTTADALAATTALDLASKADTGPVQAVQPDQLMASNATVAAAPLDAASLVMGGLMTVPRLPDAPQPAPPGASSGDKAARSQHFSATSQSSDRAIAADTLSAVAVLRSETHLGASVAPLPQPLGVGVAAPVGQDRGGAQSSGDGTANPSLPTVPSVGELGQAAVVVTNGAAAPAVGAGVAPPLTSDRGARKSFGQSMALAAATPIDDNTSTEVHGQEAASSRVLPVAAPLASDLGPRKSVGQSMTLAAAMPIADNTTAQVRPQEATSSRVLAVTPTVRKEAQAGADASPTPLQQLARQIVTQASTLEVAAADPLGPTTAAAAPLAGPIKVLTIQLQPIELGMVTVTMTLKKDALALQVETSRQEAADMISRDHETLSKILRAAGYAVDSVTVQLANPDKAAAPAQASSSFNSPAWGNSPSGGSQPNAQSSDGGRSGERGNPASGAGQSTRDEDEKRDAGRSGDDLYV